MPSHLTPSHYSVFIICLTAGFKHSKVTKNALELFFFPIMIYFKGKLTIPKTVQIFKEYKICTQFLIIDART